MENFLTTVLTGNIGTVILIIILWKSGLLKYLLNKNGERDLNDGQPITTIREIANQVGRLEQHYNSDTTVLLQDIKICLREQTLKLDKISDNITFIKARINGK